MCQFLNLHCGSHLQTQQRIPSQHHVVEELLQAPCSFLRQRNRAEHRMHTRPEPLFTNHYIGISKCLFSSRLHSRLTCIASIRSMRSRHRVQQVQTWTKRKIIYLFPQRIEDQGSEHKLVSQDLEVVPDKTESLGIVILKSNTFFRLQKVRYRLSESIDESFDPNVGG